LRVITKEHAELLGSNQVLGFELLGFWGLGGRSFSSLFCYGPGGQEVLLLAGLDGWSGLLINGAGGLSLGLLAQLRELLG
jgi:hypothetical protein